MSLQGYIKLHRKIKDCWLWDGKPFDKRSAWIDLLLSASHQDTKFLLGNELIEIKRGMFVTSELKLMNRWGWSKSKVRAFLKVLENDSMIEVFTDKKKTTINIVNYDLYQDSETTKEPQKDHEETTKRPQKDTINNEKNEKNEKNNIYSSIVSYLNEKAGTNYKPTSRKTQDLIKARLNEKFTVDDFKTVIDKKVAEWKGTDMEKYLRPETLFGTKFEGYLNQKSRPTAKADNRTNFEQREVNDQDFDGFFSNMKG